MFVLPYLLSEEQAALLTDEQLGKLAACSTNVLVGHVKSYLSNSSRDMAVANRIHKAYSHKLDTEKFFNNEELQECVKRVSALTYDDINPGIGIETLQEYRNDIKAILNEDLAVPYIAPIRGSIIEDFLVDLKECTQDNPELKKLLKVLSKNKTLFKDPRNTPFRGTIVKSIVRDQQRYEIMLHGIDFLINKAKEGKSPSSWRYL